MNYVEVTCLVFLFELILFFVLLFEGPRKKNFSIAARCFLIGMLFILPIWFLLRSEWNQFSTFEVLSGPTATSVFMQAFKNTPGFTLETAAIFLFFSALNDSLHITHFLFGYIFTFLIELIILFFGLSGNYKLKEKIILALSLNAFTFPVVNVVLPLWIDAVKLRMHYFVVSEVLACVLECILFVAIFAHLNCGKTEMIRNCSIVVAANVVSFVLGLILLKP